MASTPNIQGQSPKDIIGKGGPIAGSALSIIGSIITIIGFVLPWVSCGGYRVSGLDITTQSLSGQLDSSSGGVLILIPCLALIILGMSISYIPISLRRKSSKIFKLIWTSLIPVISIPICCLTGLFFINSQVARNDPLGGFIQIDYGFWVSVLGILVTVFGGLLSVITSIVNLRMSGGNSSTDEKA